MICPAVVAKSFVEFGLNCLLYYIILIPSSGRPGSGGTYSAVQLCQNCSDKKPTTSTQALQWCSDEEASGSKGRKKKQGNNQQQKQAINSSNKLSLVE